jgi:hypothetical protein
MSELDEAWAFALADAEHRARASGRADIGEYIALRSSNDRKRKFGADWIVKAFTEAAGEVNRAGASIQTSNADGHRFKVGSATMVGRLLTLTSGVRSISIEVGWPRTPSDGFVRGGGLACANIQHFGMKAASEHLRLEVDRKGLPHWQRHSDHGKRGEFHEADVKHHLEVLLTDSRNPPTRR